MSIRPVHQAVTVALVALPMMGCATIGPAPPKLSAELGDRMAEMSALHHLTLQRYFASERRRVEDFLEREWIPLFLKNYLGISGILNDLETGGIVGEIDEARIAQAAAGFLADTTEAPRLAREIVTAIAGARSGERGAVRAVLARFVEDDQLEAAATHVLALLRTADPGLLIIEWAQDAQREIDAQRREMMTPLLEAEQRTTAELTEAYADILKANGVITARLEAAADVRAAQDQLLTAFGAKAPVDEIQRTLADVSAAVGTALDGARGLTQSGGAAPDSIARAFITTLRTAFQDTTRR